MVWRRNLDWQWTSIFPILSVRKSGTDASLKEIRVTGVAKSMKMTDLESLFSKVNTRPIGAEFD